MKTAGGDPPYKRKVAIVIFATQEKDLVNVMGTFQTLVLTLNFSE